MRGGCRGWSAGRGADEGFTQEGVNVCRIHETLGWVQSLPDLPCRGVSFLDKHRPRLVVGIDHLGAGEAGRGDCPLPLTVARLVGRQRLGDHLAQTMTSAESKAAVRRPDALWLVGRPRLPNPDTVSNTAVCEIRLLATTSLTHVCHHAWQRVVGALGSAQVLTSSTATRGGCTRTAPCSRPAA